MKKTVLSSMLIGAMTLSLGALFSTPAFAQCPLKSPCEKNCIKPAPIECKKSEQPEIMTPEEKAKFKEEMKEEFYARLQLTESQKAQMDKIKADEKKALAPYREKIKKEEAKLNALYEKEKAIRIETMHKFEATLTPEQKEELSKIKQEIKEFMPKHKMHRPFAGARCSDKCPPNCKCKCCHPEVKSPEPSDCKCPCHKSQFTPKPYCSEPTEK